MVSLDSLMFQVHADLNNDMVYAIKICRFQGEARGDERAVCDDQ